MATMKDVAKRAQVSVATVSAVINQSAYVSEELRARVLAAVQELGYRPNALARSLKKNRSRLLGFMVRNFTNPYYPEMLMGAEDAAREAGYHLLVCTTADESDRERAFFETLLEHRVEGMLLAIVDQPEHHLLQRLQAEKIPFMLVNRWPEGYAGHAVTVDNKRAGLIATNHLLSLGYREIAFMGASRTMVTSNYREAGYREALIEAGVHVPEQWIRYCGYSEEVAYDSFRALINEGTIPQAVFAGNDLMAFGIIRALLEAGLRVPEDLAVVGCDNIDFSSKFLIPLTTVHIPKYEMGRLAANLLIQNIQRNTKETVEENWDFIQLDPKLIIRQSCGIHLQNRF